MGRLSGSFKKKHVLFFIIFSLTACGFHLRGALDIPKWLDNITIINEGERSLTNSLTTLFNAYNIKVSTDAQNADYWLIIKRAEHTQQITGIGSGSNPRQYQLFYIVDFLLQNSKGKLIKPLSHITVTRQLTVNNNRILGSDDEASLLITEMRQEAAAQIINRLNYQ